MNDSQKLDLLLVKFDGMNSDIQILKEDVSFLKKEVTSLDKRVTKLERGQSELKELCLKNQSDIAEVRELCLKNQSDITEIRSDITEIRLTLENEIRTNIRLIAEGHLDLSRQLHDALHTSNEFENMKVRVNSLEVDMKRVKQKVFA